MDYKALGNRIRHERHKFELTQEELAEKVNVTTAYIGQIERGERKFSIETLVNISSILNVSVDYLLLDNLTTNTNAALADMINLLDNRPYQDIVMAVDVVRSVFHSVDKAKK